VVGSSGRIAAQALQKAGYTIDVFDCFGDLDTRQAARNWTFVTDTEHAPFLPSQTALIPIVKDWKTRHPSGGILATSGFESAPETLAVLQATGRLLGNTAQSVERCKNPWEFAQICEQEGFHTPPLFAQSPFTSPSPSVPPKWLKKESGASGGTHVQKIDAEQAHQLAAPFYAQQFIEGKTLSALFLSEADNTTVLSLHEQYLAPTPTAPYRFGGLVAVDTISEQVQDRFTHACCTLAREFNLTGLNGLDAIWDGKALWLLEINPRPPASLALLSPEEAALVFTRHIQACSNSPHFYAPDHPNTLANSSLENAQAYSLPNHKKPSIQNQHNLLNRGMAIVYASAQLSIPADFRFPPGCHDLPILPREFHAGEPVCSIVVSDGGVGKLRAQVNALRECLKPVAGLDLLSSL
jgi:hypothetical protein